MIARWWMHAYIHTCMHAYIYVCIYTSMYRWVIDGTITQMVARAGNQEVTLHLSYLSPSHLTINNACQSLKDIFSLFASLCVHYYQPSPDAHHFSSVLPACFYPSSAKIHSLQDSVVSVKHKIRLCPYCVSGCCILLSAFRIEFKILLNSVSGFLKYFQKWWRRDVTVMLTSASLSDR